MEIGLDRADTLIVKADLGAESKPSLSYLNSIDAAVRVKDEEPEDGTIDAAIPIADDSDDMFGDAEEEDDEGDETEDEIVDFTYEGLVHIQGIEHFVCRSFKIRQIPQPEVRMIDLQSLFGCLEYGSIVLNPEYQREAVWDEHRASTLISSLSMGYFVPPIIFNRKVVITETLEGKRSEQKKICVDGKQRLTSIFKFMTGKIGIWDSNSPQKKWYFCHPTAEGEEGSSHHNIMPQSVRDFFKQRRLCCYEYEDLSKDTEENMFQLVQRGIALTPAEKMRAMSTEWSTFTKQYVEDYSIVVNLSKQHRASGFRSVLTIFAMVQEVRADRTGRPVMPILQASAQALNKLLEDKEPINPVLKLIFKTIFDKIETLVKLSSTQLTATKYKLNKNSVFDPAPDFLREEVVSHVRTFSPVELICTAVLVSYHMESRTNEELLGDVKNLRHRLRVRHKDLRVNTECWRTAWDFISKVGTDAEVVDYIPPPRRRKTVKKSSKRPTKAIKSKPSSRKKKPQRSNPRTNPRAKIPQKPSKAKKANRYLSSASSSELSSAPSSDSESSDEFTSGISSPLFPNILLATTNSSSRAQSQSANQSENAAKASALPLNTGEIDLVTGHVESAAEGGYDGLPLAHEESLSNQRSIEASNGLLIPEVLSDNNKQAGPGVDKDRCSIARTRAITVDAGHTQQTPAQSNNGLINDQAMVDVEFEDLEQNLEDTIIQNSLDSTKSTGIVALLESQDMSIDLTEQNENVFDYSLATQPQEMSSISIPRGLEPAGGNQLVKISISPRSEIPKSDRSNSNFPSSNLSTPVIKTEPDLNRLQGPDRMPPFNGTNPPPKPKSRFKPRVPPRPEWRSNAPMIAATSVATIKTENKEPVSKRPRERSPNRFGPVPKRPREDGCS